MKTCPRGHELTPENLRERWTRGRIYPLRECRTCIRDKRKSKPDHEYHRQYMALHRRGKEKTQIELSEEEREMAKRQWFRHINRRSLIRDYKTKLHDGLKHKIIRENILALTEALQNEELASLIREQQSDDKYYINSHHYSYDDSRSHLPRVRRKTSEFQPDRMIY